MRIAVTGASGYVGGRIADHLRMLGHEVLALSRRPCDAPWMSYSLADDPSQLPWHTLDALVHAAYDFSPGNWNDTFKSNVEPSAALFKAAARAGIKRLVFISSMSAFDGCRSDYGKAKLEIESHALGVAATVIRPGLVWGSSSGGVMGNLEAIVGKLPVVPCLTGPRGLPQFLVHEDDLAQAVSDVVTSGVFHSGSIISVMHPASLSLRQILELLAKRRNLSRCLFPVHWLLVMAALKSAESLGIRLPFRSDSLVGLVHGNPAPVTPTSSFACRPFA